MKTENSPLSAQESLHIITDMIRQSKGNAQNYSFYFLLWGWVVVLANLGMYALTFLHYAYPSLVWVITFPAAIISALYGYRQEKKIGMSTHLDTIGAWLWISYSVTIFTVMFFGSKIHWQINPVMLIFSAVPTLVTGKMLKFKPLVLGGISFWILGLICFLVPLSEQPLVSAVGIIIGYLVPGYQLRNKKIS